MSIARTALKGVTYYDSSKTFNGYTLFGIFNDTDVWLIDMEGHIVHRWKLPSGLALYGILLPNGNLLYPGITKSPQELGLPSFGPVTAGGLGGELVEIDWEGNIVWRVEAPYQHHAFGLMNNGHIIFPTHHPKGILPDELVSKWKGGWPGTEVRGKEIWGDTIDEIDRDGNIVWWWQSYEHLDPDIDTFCPLENRTHWHINGVWQCRDGNILISPRWQSMIWRIEYPSGKVIARYGKGKIFHQHDVQELDNGNIMCFDNGAHRSNYYGPPYSRVVEMDPNTGEIVWEYKDDPPWLFYSATQGGNQRLPNGNTLICETAHGRIFEVTYDGELVWEYLNPRQTWQARNLIYTGGSHHAFRYPPDYPGLKGKDLDSANYPWENHIYGPDACKKDFRPLIF